MLLSLSLIRSQYPGTYRSFKNIRGRTQQFISCYFHYQEIFKHYDKDDGVIFFGRSSNSSHSSQDTELLRLVPPAKDGLFYLLLN